MTSATERFLTAAHSAGCPPDQVRNFLSAGIVLQPKQLAFAAAARLCDRPGGPTEVALGGARGPGKSHGLLCQLGDDGLRHAGLKALLLRKVGGSAKEGFETLLPKTIGPLGRYTPSHSIFRFHNSSSLRLGHFQNERDIDKYLGLEYDVVAIEEATTLSASKKTAVFSCCRSPTDSGWRARKYLSTNPGGVGHAWFKQRFVIPFRNGAETETRFIPCTVDDNRFAAAEYVAFLDGLTGWLKAAWRYGDFDIAAGQYFTTWSHDRIVRPDVEAMPHWRTWLALDYGFTHYTAAYLFAQDGDGTVYVIDEHAERRWLVERHAAALDAMLARHSVPKHRIETTVAGGDVFARRHNGNTVAEEYAAHGYDLSPANDDRVNGAAEVLRRLGDPDAGIQPSLVISSRCARLIECLPSLEHDPHRPEDVLKTDTDDNGLGGDDAYDAARYGLMVAASRRELVAGPDPFGDARW
jgi:phage terminase large subunit